MIGFYRECIKDFANIAEPLNRLTSDKALFEWTKECEEAFETLKNMLIRKPVLAFPNPSKEFVLEVDASNIALGGVLSQYQDDNILHPVAYFSNALSEGQKKWSTYNKETFALVCALRHWYLYLIGKSMFLFDHLYLTIYLDTNAIYLRQ